MSNVQLILLAAAAMTSIMVAATMPGGPSLLTDRTWSESRSAVQLASSAPSEVRLRR